MKLLNALLSHLKKKDTHEHEDVPAGMCPNCWGREEYGGKFFEAVKNNVVDINHADPHVGWIQDYANKHLKGIALVHREGNHECDTCKISYKPEE